MDGLKFSVKVCLLFVLGLGFFMPTDLWAKQISRLLCTSSWSQDFTLTELENFIIYNDGVLSQFCDEDGNTPFHVVLRLEHLSRNQRSLILFGANFVGKDGLQSKNKQGESPLDLLKMRVLRVFERMSDSSLEEIQAMFEEESYIREITEEMFFYFIIQISVMENSSEDTMKEEFYVGFSSALDHLNEDDQERLWKELEEQMGAMLWH